VSCTQCGSKHAPVEHAERNEYGQHAGLFGILAGMLGTCLYNFVSPEEQAANGVKALAWREQIWAQHAVFLRDRLMLFLTNP